MELSTIFVDNFLTQKPLARLYPPLQPAPFPDHLRNFPDESQSDQRRGRA